MNEEKKGFNFCTECGVKTVDWKCSNSYCGFFNVDSRFNQVMFESVCISGEHFTIKKAGLA